MRNDFVTQALRCGNRLLHSITSSILTDTRGGSVTHRPSLSLVSGLCDDSRGLTLSWSSCHLFRLPSSLLYNKSQELTLGSSSLHLVIPGDEPAGHFTAADSHPAPRSTPLQVTSAHLNSTSLRLPAPQHLVSPQCGHSPFQNDSKESQDGAATAHVT